MSELTSTMQQRVGLKRKAGASSASIEEKAASEDSGYNSASEEAATISEEDLRSGAPPRNNSNFSSEALSGDENCNDDDDDDDDDDNYDIDDEDMDRQIAYLRAKQLLLTRVSHVLAREDAYHAARALYDANHPHADARGSVWTQAREYLALRNPEELGDPNAASLPPPPVVAAVVSAAGNDSTTSALVFRKRSPLIDISQVMRTTSKQFGERSGPDLPIKVSHSALPLLSRETITAGQHQQQDDAQWMERALVWCTSNAVEDRGGSSSSTPTSRQPSPWRVVADPHTGATGLVPPRDDGSIDLDAVGLEEATGLTAEPRLVAQSAPPFRVVHVNKAFLVVAGLQSSKHIIGQPIESVLHVAAIPDAVDYHSERFLPATIGLTSPPSQSLVVSPPPPCRIRVVPVLDRSKRRRLVVPRRTAHFVSHLLVVVAAAGAATTTTEVAGHRRQ